MLLAVKTGCAVVPIFVFRACRRKRRLLRTSRWRILVFTRNPLLLVLMMPCYFIKHRRKTKGFRVFKNFAESRPRTTLIQGLGRSAAGVTWWVEKTTRLTGRHRKNRVGREPGAATPHRRLLTGPKLDGADSFGSGCGEVVSITISGKTAEFSHIA